MVEVGGNLSSHTSLLCLCFHCCNRMLHVILSLLLPLSPGTTNQWKKFCKLMCLPPLLSCAQPLKNLTHFTSLLQNFAWAPVVLKAALLNTRLNFEGVTCLPLGSSKENTFCLCSDLVSCLCLSTDHMALHSQ